MTTFASRAPELRSRTQGEIGSLCSRATVTCAATPLLRATGRWVEVVAHGDHPSGGYLVAAAGPTLSGERVVAGAMAVLPAVLVERIDPYAPAGLPRRLTRRGVRAPAFEGDRYQDGALFAELGDYYASLPQFDREDVG